MELRKSKSGLHASKGNLVRIVDSIDKIEELCHVRDLQQNPEEAITHLDYLCHMATFSAASHMRQAKILCTIGKSSRDVEVLMDMMAHGMDIARIQMGRGTYEYHKETIQNIRLAVMYYSRKLERPYPLAIALDLKGAEIRTGDLEHGSDNVDLKAGATTIITTDEAFAHSCNASKIYVDYKNITKVLSKGCQIYLNRAQICLVVKNVTPNSLECTVVMGGKLKSYLQVNLPEIVTDLPSLSEGDINDIQFAKEQDVDVIIVSFVRDAEVIREVRDLLGREHQNIMVIAKIENHEGLDYFTNIAEKSDGIMVARGDLGVEMSLERVFLAQKYLVSVCNLMNKPVFVVSEILDTMVSNPKPARSEAADIVNAVLDGVDVLCLSRETSKGKFVVESVTTASEICQEAETCIWRKQTFMDLAEKTRPPVEAQYAVGLCAVEASYKVDASAIIVVTTRGNSAKIIAKYRPRCPIIAVTTYPQVARNLCCYKGILPLLLEKSEELNWVKGVDARIQSALKIAQREQIIKVGQAIIVVNGWKQGVAFTNTMRIIYVPSVDQSILY